MVNNKISHECR